MSFKDKIAQRIQERNVISEESENGNSIETSGELLQFYNSAFFGIENVRNYISCLDLRFSDGKFKALPYSYILEINFDPSEGIEIITSTKKILVSGRNLKLLYNYLTAFRVKYIQANIGNDLEEEKSLFVKGIFMEEV